MIRIAISVEAFEAITATLPFGSMSFENKTNERGERLIWFLSVHAAVHNTFNVQRHLTSRRTLRVLRDEAFRTWRAATAA